MSELNKAVADLVIKATQAAEAAGKFAVEQLPDVAHQYVLYVAVISWAMVILGILLFLLLFFLEKFYDVKGDNLFFLSIFTTSIGLCLVGFNISNAIMATVAPKVLLIQWAAELVK